ncbi:MAG: dipeptidase PepE [Rubricoccaceae bacterium]|nr:dipeptidase PepE [Rubricoccaceae bacterium]
MRLLLLSNSTTDAGYLAHAAGWLRDFLGEGVGRVLFVPYAGVTISWDDYAARVREVLAPMGYALDAIHEADDPVQAVEGAEAVAVGGGNTFRLVERLHRLGLIEAIRARVRDGAPYVGWSAGANVACPTLRTTNDMPILEPPSFETLDVVPFQINPHYTDAHPPGHRGETRADRIAEFTALNPDVAVAGLPEGTALRREDGRLDRLGPHPLRLFHGPGAPREVTETDVSFLL